ncbi:ankyrin repeat-containing domain protein [Trichoderma chlorosporum]
MANVYTYSRDDPRDIIDRFNGLHLQSLHQRNLGIKALSWIIYAKRPLSALELQIALGVEIGTEELDLNKIPQIDDIVSSAFGLLVHDKESNMIHLVHYASQESLERDLSCRWPIAETYIAEVCSTYLSYSVFGTGYCNDDYGADKRKQSYKFYEYAAEYWNEHVEESDFSQIHVEFLKKTLNVEPFIQAIDHLDVECRYQTGLHIAAGFGLDEIVEALLGDPDDADVCDFEDQTPFYMAACGGHREVMKILFERGEINVNAISSKTNYTPLMCAAQGNHVAAVEFLLTMEGIEVNHSCSQNRDALWYAAVCGYTEIVQLLLGAQSKAQKCDPDMLCESRSSALIGAVVIGQTEVVAQLLKAEHVNVNIQTDEYDLITWGYDYENYDCGLFWMDPHNDATVYRHISKYAEGPYDYLNKEMTPLHLAVELEREDIVKLLLSQEEVDVNLASGSGETALSMAREGTENFRLLLERGGLATTSSDTTSSESCSSEDDVDMEY